MFWVISNIESEEDRTFVEEIYIKYERKMYVIANRILENHHDAQDCVHDTVKIIIENLDKFKSAFQNHALDSLIMIACRNCAINMYNKRKKRLHHETSNIITNMETNSTSTADIPDLDADIAQLVSSEERVKKLTEILCRLDPIYFDALTLKMMDFSYEEIAALMSVSQETARQRIHRARQNLISMMNEEVE